jgi:hypothetical protein
LFSGITGGAQNMFRSAFYQCKGITVLPEDLFAGITLAEKDEFKFTFFEATGLKGQYIPASMFSGLINAGHPQPSSGTMWYQTFEKTGLVKNCPASTHPVTTGYEGSVAESTWTGYVACEPDNPCVGAEYWDSTNEECVQCPAGYDDDISNAKDSIDQCKINCATGTYLANIGDSMCTDAGVGYYAAGGTVDYGSTSSRTQCPDAMPTINNTTTADAVSQCVVYCRGTYYRSPNNTCVECPQEYDDDIDDGKTSITDCKIRCAAGTYLSTEHMTSCENVGDGYWAESTMVAYGSTSLRNQCPNGEMTGMVNASSSSQCIELLCAGATYRDSVTGNCVSCPAGYDAHVVSGKTAISDCQIHCEAGTYLANANDTVCTPVGDGYYSDSSDINYGFAGTISRHQCPNGEMTGTQTATNQLQCLTPCVGAQYYDSTIGECTNCPSGYTDNTINGKASITQCQHYCSAGSYAETYTQISYLQSDGTNQFIDTGYEITGTHVNGVAVVSTNISLPRDKNYGNFFGNIYGPGGFSAGHKKGVFGLWIQAKSSGGKAEYSTLFNIDQQYTLTYDVSTDNTKGYSSLKVDGNNATPNPLEYDAVKINGSGNTFKVFSNGGAAVVNGVVQKTNYGDKLFAGRIYSLTLYEDGILVLDLVPVRRGSDNALGMLNRITNEFYANSGQGEFTAGADVGNIFVQCTPVGNGYYAGESYTSFGEVGTRNQCPNGVSTVVNGQIINNASSIYQCSDVIQCSGATYPNKNTGVCTACPTGYSDDITDNKQTINDCKIRCAAGTYLASAYDTTCSNVGDGYYTGAETVSFGDVGTRTRCPNGEMTNTNTATSIEQCGANASSCIGAEYMNDGVCVPCPTGYTDNIVDGKNAITDCQIICPAGSYMDIANGNSCSDAGVGYWATGGAVNYGSTSSRNQCASGLTTVGYGHGADELSDCGRKLHINGYTIYAKTTKQTEHAINIQPEDDSAIYYISVSDSDHTLTPLHINQGNSQYTAFDDSILYGERDFETNTRINQ